MWGERGNGEGTACGCSRGSWAVWISGWMSATVDPLRGVEGPGRQGTRRSRRHREEEQAAERAKEQAAERARRGRQVRADGRPSVGSVPDRSRSTLWKALCILEKRDASFSCASSTTFWRSRAEIAVADVAIADGPRARELIRSALPAVPGAGHPALATPAFQSYLKGARGEPSPAVGARSVAR